MISLRLDRPLIYFDLETTGLDLYRDQIVQIAAIKYFKLPFKKQSVTHNIFNDCVKLDRYILPTCEIASEAIDVHKLTREKLIDLTICIMQLMTLQQRHKYLRHKWRIINCLGILLK